MTQKTINTPALKWIYLTGVMSCWGMAILSLGNELAQWFGSQGHYPKYLLLNVGIDAESLVNPPNPADLMLIFSITLVPKILNSLANVYLGIFFIELFVNQKYTVTGTRLMFRTGAILLLTVPCSFMMEIAQTYLIILNLSSELYGIDIDMHFKSEYHFLLVIGLLCIIISKNKEPEENENLRP